MLKRRLKHFLIIILTAAAFCWPQIINASAPTLISPTDNSQTQTPKLIWEYGGECVQSGSCFKVEIDNNEDFSSLDKSTYTNNFSYSPQGLAEGIWNWRVKAKDKSEKWSEWSQKFKFIILSNSDSPSPSPSESNPSQAPSSSPTSEKLTNIFLIKDTPTEINSDEEIEAVVILQLPDKQNSIFYIKGAFKKADGSNYFGKTFYQNQWVLNNSKYLNQFKITTDSQGLWEGKIKVKPDSKDSGFDGSGNYIFKAGRYSESGSGPIWSNEITIKINAVIEPDQKSIPEEQEENIEVQKEKITNISSSLVKIPSNNFEVKIASVAGEATKSDNIPLEEAVKIQNERKINWVLILLGISVFGGGIGYGFFKMKKEKSNEKSYN